MIERRYRETENPEQRAELEAYMSAEPCPACQGRRLKPEALAVRVGGRADRRGVRRTRSPTSIAFFEDLRLTPARAGDRRQDPEGDPRPPPLPGQRRHRLPEPLARRGVALGRRVAAHPPGDADRLEADGRPLRPGRAVDRPAPARQPEAHRHAPLDARPRQHGHRRRARRGDDPVRRLGRSTSARARACTADASSPRGRPTTSSASPSR